MVGVRKIDRVRNERIRNLCRVSKSGNEVVSENVPRWYEHSRKIDQNRLVKRICE